MDLKVMLGEAYKDDMTVEEITAALADIDPTKGYIKKDAFDKTASELAAAKRALTAKMTEDEAKAAADTAKSAELEEKYNLLLHESTVSKHKAKFLGLGYDEKLAEATAQALSDGDMDAVFKNQSTFIISRENALKAELLKNTPAPPAGAGTSTTDYTKEIEAATAAGDYTRAAYLTRISAEKKE